MSLVWDKIIPLSQTLIDTLEQSTDDELKYTAEQGAGYFWENYIFTSRKNIYIFSKFCIFTSKLQNYYIKK